MQAIFYGIGAAVIGIISIGGYKLTTKSIGSDKLLWAIFFVLAVVTFITQEENIWLVILSGVVVWFRKAPPKFFATTLAIVPTILFGFFSVEAESKLVQIA